MNPGSTATIWPYLIEGNHPGIGASFTMARPGPVSASTGSTPMATGSGRRQENMKRERNQRK